MSQLDVFRHPLTFHSSIRQFSENFMTSSEKLDWTKLKLINDQYQSVFHQKRPSSRMLIIEGKKSTFFVIVTLPGFIAFVCFVSVLMLVIWQVQQCRVHICSHYYVNTSKVILWKKNCYQNLSCTEEFHCDISLTGDEKILHSLDSIINRYQ